MSPYAVLFVLFGVLSFGFYAYREQSQDRDVPIHVIKTIKLPIPHRER